MPAPEQVTLQRVVDLADVDLRAFLESQVRGGGLTRDEARELLLETLPGWAAPYEDASATVAADLYTQKRFAVGGDLVAPYSPVLAPPADPARWGILASWALAPVETDRDWTTAFQKIVGGAHRTIADAHRNTTMGNSVADPVADGWRRAGRGGKTCAFCRMLIGRGDVYDSISVQFKSHDNCRCAAETSFDSIESKSFADYGGSARKRKQTDDDRKRVREWLESAEGSSVLPDLSDL